MNAVKLRNGDLMPKLGLGTSKDDPIKIKAAVLEALKIGYRMIDTAFVYGNESNIGEALNIAFREGIVTREELFIVTKLPMIGHEKRKVTKYLKEGLLALQLSYVDLYLVHFPTPVKTSKCDMWTAEHGSFFSDLTIFELDEKDHLETWEGMEECVNLRLAKSIGLSNFNSKQIQNILDNCNIKPANLQAECHLYLQQEKLFNYCQEHGITFTAFAPLASPSYGGFIKKVLNIDVPKFPVIFEDETVVKLGQKYSKTPAQIALRWLLQRGICSVPKSTSTQRLRENFEIFNFSINDEEMAQLTILNRNHRQFDLSEFSFMMSHPQYPYKDEF